MTTIRSRILGLAVAASVTFAAANPADAGFITYTDKAAFNAANPGNTQQDFSAANVLPGGVLAMANPLNSATNNSIFSPGDIAAGLEIQATGNNPSIDLAVTGVGFLGMTAKTVFANFFGETLNLIFADGVGSVGMDLLSQFSMSDFTIRIYDTSDDLLDTFVVNDVPNTGDGLFFGIQATAGELIGRVNLSSNTIQAEGVSYVSFGPAGAENPIPAPAGAVLFGLGLLSMGGARLIRRKQVA
jgi:hypothetical protein